MRYGRLKDGPFARKKSKEEIEMLKKSIVLIMPSLRGSLRSKFEAFDET